MEIPKSETAWPSDGKGVLALRTNNLQETESYPLEPLVTRSYQREMFEQSMRSNTIVAMDTGSGKTWIAKLRIEAELNRTPSKIVWFTAPSVVLAEQQHKYLALHLPQYTGRLITGSDNLDLWSSEIWEAVLLNINIVVSTPQILLDSLRQAFVKMNQISLLIFDEAHHATGKDPLKRIMQEIYHPLRRVESAPATGVPHILGMTASPITTKLDSMELLESTLDAICKTPTEQLEEYNGYIHMPQFITLVYSVHELGQSLPVQLMLHILHTLDIDEDPWVRHLLAENTPEALRRYEKLIRTGSTYCMDQLKMLRDNTDHLYTQLGGWATHTWLREVLLKLQSRVEREDWIATLSDEERRYLNGVLREIRELSCRAVEEEDLLHHMSSKACKLIDFLVAEYREDASCIIFVERRSTVFALTKLLGNHPSIRYAVASLVGGSNSGMKDNLIDLADLASQKTEFEEFRVGARSILVATAVMEEGIDVQATNLVIRFDDSMTLRSYIQSRGRARKAASKFVVMRSSDELSSKKYQDWSTLEAAMKAKYMDELRQIEKKLKIERDDDEEGQVYTVKSTGAKLNFGNARSLLEHFCQLLHKVHLEPNPRPTFLCQGTHGFNMSAKVILPSSLPSELHEVKGSRTWRTEKAAKRDASFIAYKSLHKAGLVNDHLLPPCRPKKDVLVETRTAFASIRCQMSPWQPLSSDTTEDLLLHVHRLELEDAPALGPSLLLLLPDKLQSALSIPLHYTNSRSVEARVVYGGEWITSRASRALAQEITSYLLHTTLVSQSKDPESWSHIRPFYLLPNILHGDLRVWYDLNKRKLPLTQALKTIQALHGKNVLIHDTNNRAYFLDLPRNDTKQSASLFVVHEKIPGPAVLAKKLPRRIDYLSRANAPASMGDGKTALSAEGCVVSQIPTSIVEAMQFVPSITHMVGIALVSKACCDEILGSFHVSDTILVQEALMSPVANSRVNYERLEFLGDTLLKLYACLQVFSDPKNSRLPEGYLTIEAMKIENNARLQRAAIEIGLDRFMIHDPFVPKKWKPEMSPNQGEQKEALRPASTKTVADHVEALIAVAYLDDTCDYSGDQKAVALLQGLFPEIRWNLPGINVAPPSAESPAGAPPFEVLSSVESMLGYKFKRRHILAEALNHSSISAQVPTYGRLEFLGDAVLQRVVNEAVYKAAPRYSQNAMHLRQIACVSHPYLAFLCFEASHDVERVTVSTDQTQKNVALGTITEPKHLYQFMSHSSMEVGPAQQRSWNRYLECRDQIREELAHNKTYPWALLASLAAPKFFSDIIESVLGAIFIDSAANLDTCKAVLAKLGLTTLLHRLLDEPDMVLAQPKTLLWQARAQAGLPALKVVARGRREAGGQRYCCQLLLDDGAVYAEVDDARCEEEAVLRACEVGLAKFRHERQVGDMSEVEARVCRLGAEDETLQKRERKRKPSSQEVPSEMTDDE